MKTKLVIFLFLGLAAILTSCGRKPENTGADKLRSLILSKSMGDALVAKILLTEIRGGGITNAIETLEFTMDCSIVEMEHATNCDAATQQQILQTLSMLKEYRKKYPRKTEATIGEGDELKQDRKITKDAEEYLKHD